MHMPSHNVAIQHVVYEAMRKEKRTGESFTDVVARLLAERGSLEEVRGAWGRGPPTVDLRELGRLRASARRRAA